MEENQESLLLLQQMKSGSHYAFDQFYEKYHLFVFQIALHIMGNKVDAEDVCHDVFLEVYQKYDEYDPEKGSVKAWLAVKSKSRALDRLRRKKPLLVERLDSLLKEEEKAAEIEFLLNNERQVLNEALSHLPFEQREAIIESYFYGKTHQEISTTMKKPLGTVKSMIRYGLNHLRKSQSLLSEFKPVRGGENHDL